MLNNIFEASYFLDKILGYLLQRKIILEKGCGTELSMHNMLASRHTGTKETVAEEKIEVFPFACELFVIRHILRAHLNWHQGILCLVSTREAPANEQFDVQGQIKIIMLTYEKLGACPEKAEKKKNKMKEGEKKNF